jgi:hypothetical protein
MKIEEEEDAAMKWIRDVRHKISAEFDHDPKKLGDHYRELEKKYANRLVRTPVPKHDPKELVA